MPHLKHKKAELNSVLAGRKRRNLRLKEKAEEYAAKIEDRLLKAYQRIRSSVMNKLAVVPISAVLLVVLSSLSLHKFRGKLLLVKK